MKNAAFNELSEQELLEKIKELKAELFNLRFQQVTGQLQNPITIRDTRRNIARVKTILRERELKAQA